MSVQPPLEQKRMTGLSAAKASFRLVGRDACSWQEMEEGYPLCLYDIHLVAFPK